jgi:hypothetical protein
VLGWLDLGIESGAVRVLAEATLTLVLFADASRIDLAALRREIALPARLLGIGLPLTIAVGTVIAAVLFTAKPEEGEPSTLRACLCNYARTFLGPTGAPRAISWELGAKGVRWGGGARPATQSNPLPPETF